MDSCELMQELYQLFVDVFYVLQWVVGYFDKENKYSVIGT